jgi:DNA-binding transcriptional ArsR family regulator
MKQSILNHMVSYQDDVLDAVFSALGNPTRRKILLHLRDGLEVPASCLARLFPMTLPGITKHLTALQRAGLVGQRKQGRERLYWLLPEPLEIANAWLDEYEAFWNTRLDSLNAHIRQEPPDEA